MNNRLTFLIIFIFILTNSLLSQKQLVHEKKVYTNQEGRLFVQKEMPIYLRIATNSSEDAESFLLHSVTSKKYSNPMYFDSEGKNTIRSPWAVDTITRKTKYPLEDVVFEVWADSKPPVTTYTFGDNKIYKNNNKLYLKGGQQISLNSTDALSGIENIYHSIDKAAFSKYSNPIPLTQEREYFIKFYSVDNVGNVEITDSITVVIDGTNPKTD